MILRCSSDAYARCPTNYLCGSVDDATFAAGSDCDKFNQRIEMQRISACHMCLSADIDPELTSSNDLSYVGVGSCENGYRLMLKSGAGKPTEIEVEQFSQQDREWHLIGFYRPQYCPNCGRKLINN